jgi:hypothetical protein
MPPESDGKFQWRSFNSCDKYPFKRKPIAQVLRMPPEIQIAVPVEILQLMWPDEEDKCHSKVNSIAQVLGGCLQNPIPVEIL